jgi:ornithine--oxo-acid transaminase
VTAVETTSRLVAPETMALLRRGSAMQMDHYAGGKLPFACIRSHGLVQQMARLDASGDLSLFDVIDASGGYASACLGAGHSAILDALSRAVAECGYVTDELASLERASMLDELFGEGGTWSDRFPASAYHVSGRNSGSEAVELALRLVVESAFDLRRLQRRPEYAQRSTILAFEGAWHGWTLGTSSLLNRRHYRVGVPHLETTGTAGVSFTHIPFGELAMLESYFASNGDGLLAVVVEPIQGDAGILVPPPGYLRRLAELCRAHGVLLVADEVLTFAKTGSFFAMSDDEGPIATDITVIGKSLGMGVVSTSMVIARRELSVRASGVVATSDLRPVTCAIIRAGIAYIVKERLIERSALLGAELAERLRREVVDVYPGVYREVRGKGYMNGIELTEDAANHGRALRSRLIEAGVYVEMMAGCGRRSQGLRYVYPCLRVAPPLIAGDHDVAAIAARIARGTARFVEERGR